MSVDWPSYTIEEIAAELPNALSTGPFGSAISSKFFTDNGVPVIRGGNLSADVDTRLSDEGLVFVSPEKAKEFSRSIVRKGDLIFTCWGTINQVGFLDGRSKYAEYIISNKQMKLTPDPKKINPLFLYYVFSSPAKQAEILANGIGAAVPGFNLGQLKKHIVQLPPIEVQDKIASILGTIDGKIELNRQINQTLEQIAQTIFKSWFVDFEPVKAKIEAKAAGRDPERAAMCAINGKSEPELDQLSPEQYQQLAATAALFPDALVESELGMIPEGWGVKPLGEITSYLNRGISPKYTEAGGVLVLNQKCIRGNIIDASKARRHDVTQRKIGGRELSVGDVLVNSTGVGTLGRVAQLLDITETIIVDSHVTVVRAKSPLTWNYLGLELLRRQEEIEGLGEGSTGQTELNRGKLAGMMFTVPPVDVLKGFDEITIPLRKQFSKQLQQCETLSILRDTLLPKLLSGKMTIESASDEVATC